VPIWLVAERPFPLKTAVRTSHLAVIGGEDDDRVPPQVHVVQHIHNLLNVAVTVPDGVQVVVVKDGPHILAICGDCAGPAVPTFLVFQECTRHSGCSQRFLETWWKRERPFLLVSRVRRWRRRLWREWLLDGGLAGDIAVSVHDVVRIDETRNHEEGLAGPARFHGHDAQPAHAFAGGQTIIVKTAEWIAVGVATFTEY